MRPAQGWVKRPSPVPTSHAPKPRPIWLLTARQAPSGALRADLEPVSEDRPQQIARQSGVSPIGQSDRPEPAQSAGLKSRATFERPDKHAVAQQAAPRARLPALFCATLFSVDRVVRWYRSARRHRIGKAHALHVITTTNPNTGAGDGGCRRPSGVDRGRRPRHRIGDRGAGPRRQIVVIHVMPTSLRRTAP